MEQDEQVANNRQKFHEDLENEHAVEVIDYLQEAWDGSVESFEAFVEGFMTKIESCRTDFPQFEYVRQLGDISTMKADDWERDRKLEVGVLTTHFGSILADGCSRCGRKALSLHTQSLGFLEGDHDRDNGTKTDGPSDIAYKKGPKAWCGEMVRGQVDMKCGCCHKKDELSHPQRGQDNPEKDVCFLHQREYSREDRRTFRVSP